VIRYFKTLLICVLLFAPLGCSKKSEPAGQRKTSSPEMGVMTVLPDNVLAFFATSGCEKLGPAFEKSALGQMWNDPEVQGLFETFEEQFLTKLMQQVPGPNEAPVPYTVLDFARIAAERPILVGAAGRQTDDGPPVYGFAILDAGPQKAEIAAGLSSLEALAGEGGIVDVEVGSFKMHGPKDSGGVPGYWGWVGDYLVLAVNDANGLALKHLRQPRPKAPDYLQQVPTDNDLFAMYVDPQRIGAVVQAIAEQESATDYLAIVEDVVNTLGLSDIGVIISRVGFDGADLVYSEDVRIPEPRRGLLANIGTLDLKIFDHVDSCAVTAAAVNYDLGGTYDTIMAAIQTALSEKDFAGIQESIAGLESGTQIKIRDGLLQSLAGPMVLCSIPSDAITEAPTGGIYIIAELTDPRLMEETLTALGKFTAADSNSMLQVNARQQADGGTLHTWVIGPLAMMQLIPCWTIDEDRLIIATNPSLYKIAKDPAQSIRTVEGFKKATAGLPKGLIAFTYTDSKVQFKEMMQTLQQFWPMLNMFAIQARITLPPSLPSLTHIAEDLGHSSQFVWLDAEGLHSRGRGPGIELTLQAAAGVGLGMGITMPALARTRQIAYRMYSATNLSGIGKACLIYANDPPSLEELIDKAELTAISLESRRKPEDFDGPSFVYIPGQKIDMDPGNIIAYENPAFLTDGTNVLYLDSHVAFLKPDEFLKDLEATYERLEREMPEIKFLEAPKNTFPIDLNGMFSPFRLK